MCHYCHCSALIEFFALYIFKKMYIYNYFLTQYTMCMMVWIDYNYQNTSNTSLFLFLMFIVIKTPLGLQNFKNKEKTSCSQMTLSCKSAINQTSLVHSCPTSSPRVQANIKSSSKGKVIVDNYQDYFTCTLKFHLFACVCSFSFL